MRVCKQDMSCWPRHQNAWHGHHFCSTYRNVSKTTSKVCSVQTMPQSPKFSHHTMWIQSAEEFNGPKRSRIKASVKLNKAEIDILETVASLLHGFWQCHTNIKNNVSNYRLKIPESVCLHLSRSIQYCDIRFSRLIFLTLVASVIRVYCGAVYL